MRIGAAAGAQLRNMNYAWMCPIPLEKAVARDPALSACSPSPATRCCSSTRPAGASSTRSCLQRAGAGVLPVGPAARRVPEPGADPGLGPAQPGPLGERRVRAADRRRHGRDDAHVIRGETLEELAAAVRERLARVRARDRRAGARRRLRGQPAARRSRASTSWPPTGDDADFGRGERAVQQLFNGDVQRGAGAHEPDDVAAQRARARTTRRWSPAARWTPRAARRPRPTARWSTTWTGRSRASTASATASPRRRRAPTGRAARRSARSSPSPTAPRTPHTEEPVREEENAWH